MSAPGLPWVASPGETLKGAPPLWARFDAEDRLAEVVAAHLVPPGVPALGEAAMRAIASLGWVEVVDAEGRSQ